MHRPESLLARLYPYIHRQQENFTTESFAHLLEHLVRREPVAAARVLDWLTGSTFFSVDCALEALSIVTQEHTEKHGIPDIRISGGDIDVLVEVKLDASLTYAQADAYAKELLAQARPRRALVALVRSQPGPLPEGTVVRTWADLGRELRAESYQHEVTGHLVNQLVGLMTLGHHFAGKSGRDITQGRESFGLLGEHGFLHLLFDLLV